VTFWARIMLWLDMRRRWAAVRKSRRDIIESAKLRAKIERRYELQSCADISRKGLADCMAMIKDIERR